MIDTDKYEGHKPAPWKIVCWERKWYIDYNDHETVCRLYGKAQKKDSTARLIADAPLLLEEVKRLRSIADDLYAYIVSDADISLSAIEEQMDWREEGDE